MGFFGKGSMFGDNADILFFIILFLLLFWGNGRHDVGISKC